MYSEAWERWRWFILSFKMFHLFYIVIITQTLILTSATINKVFWSTEIYHYFRENFILFSVNIKRNRCAQEQLFVNWILWDARSVHGTCGKCLSKFVLCCTNSHGPPTGSTVRSKCWWHNHLFLLGWKVRCDVTNTSVAPRVDRGLFWSQTSMFSSSACHVESPISISGVELLVSLPDSKHSGVLQVQLHTPWSTTSWETLI